MSVGCRAVGADDLRAAVAEAATGWLRERRGPRPEKPKRAHRALTDDEREAKAQRTEEAKRRRKEEREAKELENLLVRVGYLSRRSAREAERMLRVRVSWRKSAEPKITSVCPHALYARWRPEITARAKPVRTSRVSADGFKNIVLKRIPRGFGRKAKGTREYKMGEAGDLARYILRPEAAEQDTQAWFTNVVDVDGPNAVDATDRFDVTDRQCAQVLAFWKALEAFEAEADPDGNVFAHLILAMPHELSPEGRSRALEDLCLRIEALNLPYVAGLHRPDENGDSRNFHAHIMMATRPFRIEGPFAWSFEAAKATEFNLGAGIRWLREQAAAAFNAELHQEGLDLRYSGLSQARRGVPATGETHAGPAVTARRRKHEAEEEERRRLAEKIAAFLADAVRRAITAGEKINELAAVPALAATGLQALCEKFPNPLELKRLSMMDLLPLSEAEMATDDWFGPALELRLELQRRPQELVIERDGLPAINPATLDRRYAALLNAPALPDIVQDQLEFEYRQLVRQRQERKKRQSECDRIRRERLKFLKGAPIAVFDIGANVLPQHRHLFPPAVMAMRGVREAMMECHLAWMRKNKAREVQPQSLEVGEPPRASVHHELTPAEIPAEEGLPDEVLQQAFRRGVGPGIG